MFTFGHDDEDDNYDDDDGEEDDDNDGKIYYENDDDDITGSDSGRFCDALRYRSNAGRAIDSET